MGLPRIDLTGQRFGRLLVLGEAPRRRYGKNPTLLRFFHCVCDCGSRKPFSMNALRRGATTSCGCLGLSKRTKAVTRHGLTNSPEHRAWIQMRSRCNNPDHPGYKNYGERGVVVCEHWSGRNGFLNFLADMGPRPSGKHSIDRIGNNGNYEPSNCRWATIEEQSRNRRPNIWLEIDGVSMVLTDWANQSGLATRTLKERLTKMSPRDAITLPRYYHHRKG